MLHVIRAKNRYYVCDILQKYLLSSSCKVIFTRYHHPYNLRYTSLLKLHFVLNLSPCVTHLLLLRNIKTCDTYLYVHSYNEHETRITHTRHHKDNIIRNIATKEILNF